MLRSLLILSAALAVAPAAAQASSVSSAPVAGASFSASTFVSGANASDVSIASSGGSIAFTDALQTLHAGAGCTAGPPVLCPQGDVDFRLGGGDDILHAFSLYDLSAEGGAGDDAITISGSHTTVTGGGGADMIDAGGNSLVTVDGDGGDDEIRGNNNMVRLDGRAGDDLVVGSSNNDTVDGGGGDDQLFDYKGVQGVLSGGTGDDVIVNIAKQKFALGGTVTANGGNGADIIVGGRFGDVANGDGGNDTIDVSGDPGPDTVDCGTGRDTVYADANDTVAANCETVLPGPRPALPAVDAALTHLITAFPTSAP